jgi:hypothetical protein
MLNMNEADRQKNFDPIPDGSFLKLMLNFVGQGGSFPGCDKADEGMFKPARDTSSDVVTLECEFTVLTPGPFEHRKWKEWWVVFGGTVDEKGSSKGWNFTKQRIRAMIESASNIRPDDETPEAKAARMIPNFSALDECPFYAKIYIEEGTPYFDAETQTEKKGFDKNLIDRIVTPDMEEYAPLVRGEAVAPKPSGRGLKAGGKAPAGASATGGAAPRWKKGADAPAPEAPQQALPLDGAKTSETAAPATGPKWLRKA